MNPNLIPCQWRTSAPVTPLPFSSLRTACARCAPLLMLLLTAAAPAQAQLTYITNNDAIVISGYTGPAGEVVIPASINGLRVTTIGRWAFIDCTSLTSVVIPDTVTSIEGWGRAGFSFGAFNGCTGLTNVSLGNNVTNIGLSVFRGCTSLARVTLPQSLCTIEGDAFSRCTSLASIHISKNVSSIADGAFSGCTGLVEITVDPENAFYSSVDGVLFDRNQTLLLLYPSSKTGAYAIPQNVRTINNGAFEDCVHLTSLWVPAAVSDILWDNFVGCSSLTAIDVDPDNSSYASLEGVLFDESHTTLVRYPAARVSSYVIPQSVVGIESKAFQGCAALTDVSIPSTVTNVEYRAFYSCISLTSVMIPNSVTYLGAEAFGGCASLTNVAVSGSLECLPQGLFENCVRLSSITLPESLTRVGEDVTGVGTVGTFYGCSNLSGVYFQGNAPRVEPDAFRGCTRCTLHYLPNTAGWGKTLGGLPTALWLPQVLSPGFAIGTNAFGFRIAWASGRRVVIQACTELSNPVWTPLQSQVISNGAAYFSDTNTTAHPQRFYRVRW